jgi:RNA-binding protein
MATLTTKQRAHLKALAHPLKPILHLGKEGVTDAAARTVEEAFNTRELLKIKILDTAPESARDTGAALAARVPGGHLVQVIGRTVVLYRPHPEKPTIKLPPPKG